MKRNTFRNVLIATVAVLSLAACHTPKDVTYFQDFEAGTSMSVEAPMDIRLQPNDEIRILVSTTELEINQMFSLYGGRTADGTSSNMNNNMREGSLYAIDSEGYIRFPVLGRIHVAGLTRQEVQSEIRQLIIDSGQATDPIVTVTYDNLYVTLIGDVSTGRVQIDRDRFTVLDAIGSKGDLRITGQRTNVKVIRDNNGKKTAYEINLCSAADLYSSPAFYLQQNDVVYVEPNDKEKRNSTILGGATATPSFWMSLASFVVTVITWFK